ncbi:hypothetical protein BDZ45DRAFT_799453 [Acephala macrosclerotiorum]|nr:hypothetical protein BDZ45DRAFT_799453 [Acephala macrosclerotiorum]
MFSHLLRRSTVPSYELGYEGNEFMVKYLDCSKGFSRVLSGTKSPKPMVFTPSRGLSPLRQIQLILRKYDANRYLEDLRTAFGGELWVNGVLSHRDGVLLERPPFPLNCGQFDKVGVWQAQCTFQHREREPKTLMVGHAEGCTFVKEANDSQDTSQLASVRTKFALDTLKSLLDKVEKPSLTESEMDKKFQEWKSTKISPPMTPPDQVVTGARPERLREEEEGEERALDRVPTLLWTSQSWPTRF